MRPSPDALAGCDGEESHFAEEGTRQDGADAEFAPAAERKRVLLLEDDPSFREIMEDFLTEGGYAVTAVASGVEGVREILTGDFLAILCDMMMPGLAGDMFYRAVERTRPELCERFVFMTGHRGDAKANDFIRSVDGYVLQKPFHLKDLADSLALAEVRSKYRSVFESETADPLHPHAEPPAAAVPLGETPRRPASEGAPKEPDSLRCAVKAQKAERKTALRSVPENTTPQRPLHRGGLDLRSRGVFLATLTLFALATATLATWYLRLRSTDEVLTAEVRKLAGEWATKSVHLEQARTVHPRLQASLEAARRIREEFDSTKWTPVLRSIAASTGTGIDLRTIHTQEKPGESQAFLLRIDGTATGTGPREAADRFRQALERDLGQNFQLTELPKFEQLDDETGPQPTAPGRLRAIFTITAQIGPAISHKPAGHP